MSTQFVSKYECLLNKHQHQNFFKKLFFGKMTTSTEIVLNISGDTKTRSIIVAEEDFYKFKTYLEGLASIYLTQSTSTEESKQNEENNTCQICFDQQISTMLPCGHSYCNDCVQGWVLDKGNGSCPMCRAEVSKSKLKTCSLFHVASDKEVIDSMKEQIVLLLATYNYALKEEQL